MVERLRLYHGATELNFSIATITDTNTYVINRGSCEIEADTNVIQGSVIDFKLSDGVTTVFSAKVIEKTKDALWTLSLMTNGYELNNLLIQTVWENKSPEYIVQDIIDNYTNTLTFASSESSGITLTKYIGNAYALDIIKDMMDLLLWELVIDVNDNVYFQPKGEVDNGVTLTNGTDCITSNWKEDNNSMVNHIKVIGGFESFALQETISGTGTEFTLSKKPQGSLRVTVGGTEISPDYYTVDAENKTVTFTSSRTDPLFDYSYSRPVIVENQDDASINLYGEIYKTIPAPWLDSFSEARIYAQKILDSYSSPLLSVDVVYPDINTNIVVGEKVNVVDDIRNENEQMVVNSITWDASQGTTTYKCGSDVFVFYEWQREVQERIKKIERRFTNEDDIIFTRLFREKFNVDLEITQTWQKASPTNTFWLNHKTLNRLRSVVNGHIENFEADCSDNSNNGTWYGTGIDGSQFGTAGFRLSYGTFNGTDNYVSVADADTLDLTDDISVSFAIKLTSLPSAEKYILSKENATDGYSVRINSTNQIEFVYNDTSSNEVFTFDTVLTTGSWIYVTITKNGTSLKGYINGISDVNETMTTSAIGTNSEVLLIGKKSTNFTEMYLDELRIFNRELSSDEVTALNSKYHVNEGNVLYHSFDNPKLGIRMSARTDV